MNLEWRRLAFDRYIYFSIDFVWIPTLNDEDASLSMLLEYDLIVVAIRCS